MSKDKINYSRFWTKLMDTKHTTIRGHDKWNLYANKKEYVKNKYLQEVLIYKKEFKRLLDVKPELLMKDTDSKSVEEALDKINQIKIDYDLRYGRTDIGYDFETKVFTIYYLKIINQVRITKWLKTLKKVIPERFNLTKKLKCDKCKAKTIHYIKFHDTEFEGIEKFTWICSKCNNEV